MAYFDEIDQHEETEWVADPQHPEATPGIPQITAAWLRRVDARIRSVITAVNELREHKHSAADITSGSFAAGRIPTLAQSKVSGLSEALDGKANATDIPDVSGLASQSALDELAQRVTALESAAGGGDD